MDFGKVFCADSKGSYKLFFKMPLDKKFSTEFSTGEIWAVSSPVPKGEGPGAPGGEDPLIPMKLG